MHRVLRGDEDHGHVLVDQGDGAVLHFRGWVALGVDVRDLLELERAFQRHREVHSAAQVQHVLSAVEALGQGLQLNGAVEDLLDLRRELLQPFDQLAALEHAQVPEPGDLQGQHRQRGHLAAEGLGAGHTDLGTGAEVKTALDLPGDSGADHVHQPHGAGPAPLGLPYRSEGIRGLAALGDADHQSAIGEDRVPVAELGSVLHLHRDAGQLLDHVLADEPGVPGSAAGGDHDPVEAFELVVGEVETPEPGVAFVLQQVPAQGIVEALGLLEDLLQHEVGEPAPLDGGQVPLDLADRLLHVGLGEVAHPIPVALEHYHLAVVEVDHRTGVLQDGRGVRGHEVLALAHAHQERRAVACRDHGVGLFGADHRNAVGALHVPERRGHGVLQIVHVVLTDQVGQNLGVGLGNEGVAAPEERLLDGPRVLDDAVVDDRDAAALVHVRMGVRRGRGAVGGPAGVSDPDGPQRGLAPELVGQHRELARGFLDPDPVSVDDRKASGVVSPILHAAETLQQDRRRLPWPNVPDDSAHRARPLKTEVGSGTRPSTPPPRLHSAPPR